MDSASHRPVLHERGLASGVVLRGTRDGSAPTASSPELRDGEVLDAPQMMRLLPFWGRSPIFEERRVSFARHLGVGAGVVTTPSSDARYPGTGPSSLADGLLGGAEHGDGLWQGWWGPDVEVVLDLGAARCADSAGPLPAGHPGAGAPSWLFADEVVVR